MTDGRTRETEVARHRFKPRPGCPELCDLCALPAAADVHRVALDTASGRALVRDGAEGKVKG